MQKSINSGHHLLLTFSIVGWWPFGPTLSILASVRQQGVTVVILRYFSSRADSGNLRRRGLPARIVQEVRRSVVKGRSGVVCAMYCLRLGGWGAADLCANAVIIRSWHQPQAWGRALRGMHRMGPIPRCAQTRLPHPGAKQFPNIFGSLSGGTCNWSLRVKRRVHLRSPSETGASPPRDHSASNARLPRQSTAHTVEHRQKAALKRSDPVGSSRLAGIVLESVDHRIAQSHLAPRPLAHWSLRTQGRLSFQSSHHSTRSQGQGRMRLRMQWSRTLSCNSPANVLTPQLTVGASYVT
jgi:hypothetical protein